MLDPWCASFRRQSPVRFTADGHCVPSERGGDVLVVEQIDVRFFLEDMFAKLAEFGESGAVPRRQAGAGPVL
jgi:hypothetical protein